MKKITRILLTAVITVFCTCIMANAATDSTIKIKCNAGGYKFEGDEWTIFKIDDAFAEESKGMDERVRIKAVAQHIEDSGLVGETKTVDKNGEDLFNTEEATYFIYRSKAQSYNYEAEPFLITIPEVVNGNKYYNVEATAKFTTVDTIEPDGPNTGDRTPVALYIVLAAVSASLVVVFVVLKSKNKKGEK